MSDEKDDFSFRDECAMRVLAALLSREDSKFAVNTMIENIDNKDHPSWYDAGEAKMEKIARVSYKIADLMRKTRIASFK